LLAIPVAAGGSISVYRSYFSSDVVCQSMRSAILATMDKNVPPRAKLTLLQKDVEQFATRCAKIDPDADAIFQAAIQQLASQAVPANVAAAAVQPPSPALPSSTTPPPTSQPTADAAQSSTARLEQKGAEEKARLDSRRFDGTWVSNVSCPAAAGAQGYAYQFLAHVKDGMFHGQYGTEGKPGWTTFDGKIQPDGAADIYVKGLTNQSAFTVGNVSPGSNFNYHIMSRFEGSNGTGSRVELRPCNFTFVKK
jgi:hypothetical protein